MDLNDKATKRNVDEKNVESPLKEIENIIPLITDIDSNRKSVNSPIGSSRTNSKESHVRSFIVYYQQLAK